MCIFKNVIRTQNRKGLLVTKLHLEFCLCRSLHEDYRHYYPKIISLFLNDNPSRPVLNLYWAANYRTVQMNKVEFKKEINGNSYTDQHIPNVVTIIKLLTLEFLNRRV